MLLLLRPVLLLLLQRGRRDGGRRHRALTQLNTGAGAGRMPAPTSPIRSHPQTKEFIAVSIAEPHIDTGTVPYIAEPLFVLNPHLTVVRCSDDEVLVKHGTRSLFTETLYDEDRHALLGRLIDLHRRPGNIEQFLAHGALSQAEAELAASTVATLIERAVLVPAEQSGVRAHAGALIGPVDRLDTAVIGIVGDGALAARLTDTLSAYEPQAIVTLGADGDDSAIEGPVRPLAGAVHDEAALTALFSEATFVICALDRWSPTVCHTVNAVALAAGTPWLSVMLDGSEAIIGPTSVPGETACYAEFEIQHESTLTLRDEYLLYKEALIADPPHGRIAPPAHVDVAGGLAATAAAQFLLRGTTFTIDRAVRVNFETASIDYQDVQRLPRCPACEGLRPPYRHLFL
jgi:bacteriocin biosynthesis cyclodehydratase domain-containing protein